MHSDFSLKNQNAPRPSEHPPVRWDQRLQIQNLFLTYVNSKPLIITLSATETIIKIMVMSRIELTTSALPVDDEVTAIPLGNRRRILRVFCTCTLPKGGYLLIMYGYP